MRRKIKVMKEEWTRSFADVVVESDTPIEEVDSNIECELDWNWANSSIQALEVVAVEETDEQPEYCIRDEEWIRMGEGE